MTSLTWSPEQPPAPPRLIGRDAEVERLLAELEPAPFDAAAPLALPPVVQLCGPPGSGKTALAAHLAQREAAPWPGGVFWLRAAGEGDPLLSLERQLAVIGQRLHLDVASIPPEKLRGRIGLALGERNQPCLWIVDGAPADLQDDALAVWLAPHPVARCLLVARTPWADLSDHIVTLAPLAADDAAALVDALLEAEPADLPEDAAPRPEPGAVALLGGLPLTLVVAAGLWRGGALPAEAAALEAWLLRAHARPALLGTLAEAGLERGGDALRLAALLTRAAAFIQRDAPLLATLLGVLPSHLPISARLLHAATAALHPGGDPEALLTATAQPLDAATFWGVAALRDDPEALHLPLAAQEALRALWATPSDALLAALEAALLAAFAAVAAPADLLTAPEAPEHAAALAPLLSPAARFALLRAAGAALLRARHPYLAEHLLRRALEPPDPPEPHLRAAVLLDLARAALETGDLERTAALQAESIALEEHPDALEALAHTHLLQGEPAWRDLAERALEARAELQGDLHPDTLRALDRHTERLNGLGALPDARALLEAAYDARWQHLGPDHPATLTCARNLAFNLWKQGEPDPAHRFFEQVLERRRVTLGPEHPDTLAAMTDLADFMRDQGWLGGARALLERALDLRRKHLGDRHPEVALALNDLAVMLWHLGDVDGARDLEEAILDLRYHDLGSDHPLTLTTMNNLAVTLRRQGELDRARLLLTHVLDARRAQLGPDHPDALAAASNLAITLWEMGELQDARALEEFVLDARLTDLGPEHPDTLAAMSSLASTLLELGDPHGARDLEAPVLDALRRDLGPEHPDTLTSAAQMHRILVACGDEDAAADLLRELALDPDTLLPRAPGVMVRE